MTEMIFSLCLANQPADPNAIWSAWSFAPEVVLPMVIFSAIYVYGYAQFASRSDRLRPSSIETAAFALGMLALAVAVISPLCRMAATLAWAHMIQHALLVIVAPPLILLGRPETVFAAAMPRLKPSAEFAARPILASTIYGIAIWFWHGPRFYQAALLDAGVHLLMYASLLAASLFFWRAIIMTVRAPGERSGAVALSLLVTIIHTGLLGALLTFSKALWYPLVSANAVSWGLSPLEDQQLAGLIMWVPMGVAYLAAALAVIGAWLNAMTLRQST